MIYKVGTVEQIEKIKKHIPKEVYTKIYDIVAVLDREYGANRNIELNDGGFVIFADGETAIEEIEKIACVDITVAEWIDPVGTEYLNACCLKNNDFCVDFIFPKKLIPEEVLKEWEL